VDNVTYWNFTATIGTNCSDPINSNSETQDPADNNTPVARIENPNSALNLTIWVNAATFSGTATVPNEWYNVTNTTENAGGAAGINKALPFDTDTDTTVQIDATEFKNLWLKIYATTSGTATSPFKVLGEGA
jgi:hypothetical protein